MGTLWGGGAAGQCNIRITYLTTPSPLSLVLGFIKRMKNRAVINAFNGWVEKVSVRKRMRIFVNRMLNSKDMKDMSFGLNRWKAKIDMTEGNLSDEQKRLKEMRMKNARGLMQTWKNKTLKNVFGAWRGWVERQATGKEVVTRLVRGVG